MTDAPTAPVFNAISVVVADMAAAIDFYSLLGVRFPADAATAAHAEAPLGALRLLLDTRSVVESFSPGWTPPSGGHAIALAFECRSASEVDRLHTVATAAGHRSHRPPFDAPWGQRYAVLLDPDGNSVDLYAALS